jgi:glucose/arabinose dehydrogenase
MVYPRKIFMLGVCGVLTFASKPALADVPIYAVKLQSGLAKPIFVTAPDGDNSHLFMVEQGSDGAASVRILDLSTNTFNATPFITVTGLATGTAAGGSEQGLLGMAFDPNYATNGKFYLDYTASGGAFGQGLTKVVQYTTTNFTTASTATAKTLLQIDQPQANHNGGWLGFGKDNYLYIATGDGGNGNDQDPPNASKVGHTPNMGNAQDLTKLLGKILRIDPSADDYPADATKNYAIPKGGAGQPVKNPFYNDTTHPAALPEIWNYGLRNPWRDSFDRKTGDLYIGDVGQGNREEVNFQPSDSAGGVNFGWRVKEGTANGPGINDPGHAPLNTLTGPIFEYNHSTDGGIAITGGYVYRGDENPALDGTYFFADYARAKIWTMKYDGSGTATATLIQNPQATTPLRLKTPDGSTIDSVSSFGQDGEGRLYITELGNSETSGQLFRLVPAMPGDANGDWTVDRADFKILYDNYDPFVTGKSWSMADFNDDGVTDFLDFQILEQNFGKSMPWADLAVSAPVPEPGGLAAVLLATVLFCRRRRLRARNNRSLALGFK